MQIEKIIDQELPLPHGNRQGLSYGQLSVLLLTYIILSVLGSDKHEAISAIETYLGQHLIRAYELPTDQARSDTTSFSVYHQPREEKTDSPQIGAQPLLHKGHSKDRRPDLLQYRQMLATLDPLGMPLISATLAGNGADDPLYAPTWKRLVELIGHKDFLFLADCKASSWSNRAEIARNGGIYCFPLAMTGYRPKMLWDWVFHPPTTVMEIFSGEGNPNEPPLGKGFEVPLGSLWLEKENQKWHHWSERWLVIQSYALARRQQKGLEKRLLNAEKALAKLAAKPGEDSIALQESVDSILQRHRGA